LSAIPDFSFLIINGLLVWHDFASANLVKRRSCFQNGRDIRKRNMEHFYKKRIDIKKKAITELNIKMPHSATCVTGKWKIELVGMGLSACSKARSMLGVSTYGTFGLRDFFNLLDDQTLIKFKTWMQSICYSAVLEPVIFNVHMDNMTSRTFKITGFHYSEDWDLPSTIIGVFRRYYTKRSGRSNRLVNH
jgi:hypothetical protein